MPVGERTRRDLVIGSGAADHGDHALEGEAGLVPPSQRMSVPVRYPGRSLAQKASTSAISSGRPCWQAEPFFALGGQNRQAGGIEDR